MAHTGICILRPVERGWSHRPHFPILPERLSPLKVVNTHPLPFCPQVKLFRSENLDNPIQTVSLGQSLFFHFPPLLLDGEVMPGPGTQALVVTQVKYCSSDMNPVEAQEGGLCRGESLKSLVFYLQK